MGAHSHTFTQPRADYAEVADALARSLDMLEEWLPEDHHELLCLQDILGAANMRVARADAAAKSVQLGGRA